MSRSGGGSRDLRERLLYFGLVPATVLAVVLLGAVALRASLQIEKARQQTVFDATLSLADERVDRLDKMIVAQDNVVIGTVDVGGLSTIGRRWLPTAGRETPTIRAIVVLDAEHPEAEVRAFVSRAPSPEDDRFRRTLVHRMVPHLETETQPLGQLRHLHESLDGRNFLLSYWQRMHGGRRQLVVAWHDAARVVHDVMPLLYRDLDRNSRMNVVDQHGRILFGAPIREGSFTVGLPFPTTLYNWHLQVALSSAEGLERQADRQRLTQLAVVGLAVLIAAAGVVIVARAYSKERRLAALKGDFVANVSHELKTPLASVRMFAEMLLSSRVANEDKRREYLQIIVGESERLTGLLDNVLDFAKAERGRDAYQFEPGDVATVVVATVDSLRYRADRLGIDLRVEAAASPAVFDARAIELATMNVIDNALKYGKGTPTVDVEVGPSVLRSRGNACGARIRVKDLGPGIGPDERERVFERFERGRVAYEHHVRGSGIGLALVRHIAESHGGSVRVESPVSGDGRGAAFEILLPAAPPGYRPRPIR